jgi:hypothetical protein
MTLDLDTFLTAVYTMVDDWYKVRIATQSPKRPGPAGALSTSEVLTLAVLSHWYVFPSERAFWRWARVHLHAYFPALGSQSRFNRRVRQLGPMLEQLYRDMAQTLARPSAYRVLDATPVPVCGIARWRRSPFRGEAAKSWCAAKQEWYFGFKLFLAVTPEGVITSAALTPANVGDRPGAEAILTQEQHPTYLADKGFCSVGWEQEWQERFGVAVIAAPNRRHKRAWSEGRYRRMSGLRQVVEVVIGQLKERFGLERHRAKTMEGLCARLGAKLAAYTLGQHLNRTYHRSLKAFATLCVW